MAVINLTWDEIDELVKKLAGRLPPGSRCWGVPRGGSVVAAMLRSNHGISITSDWNEATVAVDDLIDSGRTAKHVWNKHGLKVEALFVKETTDWIVFPWEGTELREDAENTVTRFLQQIGENPNRPELERMPKRVVNSWEKLFSGYRYEGDDISGLPPGSPVDSMLLSDERDFTVIPEIPYVSSCEKHLLPFFGTACVAYMDESGQMSPGSVPMLVHALSRRLQIQDRLTGEICQALAAHSGGVAVRLVGNYVCPMVRGTSNREVAFETTAFAGKFESEAKLKNLFLEVCRQRTPVVNAH